MEHEVFLLFGISAVTGFEKNVGGKGRDVLFGVPHQGTAAQSWRTMCDTLILGCAAAFSFLQDIVPCGLTMGRRELVLSQPQEFPLELGWPLKEMYSLCVCGV